MKSIIPVFLILFASCFLCSSSLAVDTNTVNEPNYFDWSNANKDFQTLEDDSSLIGKLLTSIVVIIILGTVAYYIGKKLGPRIGASGGGKIRLIETANLGSGRQLHWIEVGNKKLLIGSTSQSVNIISEINPEHADEV